MGKKSLTKDEAFLVKVLRTADGLGDRFSEVDMYLVGKSIGQNPKSVDNIVRMLAQTNFIKKGEEGMIFLTRNGESLALELLDL